MNPLNLKHPVDLAQEFITVLENEVAELARQNNILRKLLWLKHGCPHAALYGDDGEMQCSLCLIDFKRLDPNTILDKFYDIGMKKIVDELHGESHRSISQILSNNIMTDAFRNKFKNISISNAGSYSGHLTYPVENKIITLSDNGKTWETIEPIPKDKKEACIIEYNIFNEQLLETITEYLNSLPTDLCQKSGLYITYVDKDKSPLGIELITLCIKVGE